MESAVKLQHELATKHPYQRRDNTHQVTSTEDQIAEIHESRQQELALATQELLEKWQQRPPNVSLQLILFNTMGYKFNEVSSPDNKDFNTIKALLEAHPGVKLLDKNFYERVEQFNEKLPSLFYQRVITVLGYTSSLVTGLLGLNEKTYTGGFTITCFATLGVTSFFGCYAFAQHRKYTAELQRFIAELDAKDRKALDLESAQLKKRG